ncbi:MAG: alcohol dehydrogenase catalytic domain-containing protein [Planctomycetaceae bacterium]|nr:zinc-binding dehydrogenase [Planctomycetales bacterium]MCB9922014.1 alcohol dehydrogenase catalytic domain-containing protein [Planctomycetaceae bacterium]
MTTSLAAIFHGSKQDLELRRIEIPQPMRGEILVRVLGCTLCGSDLHTFSGKREVPVPTILGHEIVGEVCEIGGPAVGGTARDLTGRELRIGDRVVWSIVASCGDCFYCLRGLPQKCLAAVKYGHEPLHPGRELTGGLAEYCLLAPGTAIVRLPDELPLSVACPASCATATISAALAAAGDVRQRNICLFGLGLLGLTASAMLRARGAANILCVDVNERRLTRAREFGATHVCTPNEVGALAREVTEGHGFDSVLELSGSPSAFASGWDLVRRGGTLVLVGSVFPTPPVSISPEQVVRRNMTIRGVHNYAPEDLLRAVEFLTNHHHDFPFAELVSEWFLLESVTQAFQRCRDSEHIRIGVHSQP